MIDYKYADLFLQNSVDKQLSIASDDGLVNITNEEIHQEEFELTESVCSESEITLGCMEAGSIKFKVSNVFLPMKGKWVTVKTVINGHTEKPYMLGRYKVYSDVPTADRICREVVAYDALYDVINADMADWYNQIFPKNDTKVTMKEFRTLFFEHFGIEQAEADLVNDDMVIEKTIEITGNSENTVGETMSGREILSCILEINGCFGHIGRDGKFHYKYLEQNINALYPRDDLYPADDIFPGDQKTIRIGNGIYKSIQYEDYLVRKIEKLQIREKENDIGVIVGDGSNGYVIEGNFLVYGKGSEELRTIANRIYEKISGMIYRPFSAECLGNPCLEVGDAVRFLTRREIIESYILKRTLKGIQALKDTYEADGEEYRTQNVNGTQRSILQLKGKTNVLERSIEETKSRIEDVHEGLESEITQTSEAIQAEVKRAQGQEVELAAAIKLTADSIETEVKRAKGSEEEMSSKISQTAEAVTSKVSKGDVSSEISQEAGSVSIKANRFSLESSNLTINSNGDITSSNGTFTAAEISSNYAQDADGWATSGLLLQRDGTLKTKYISVGNGGVSTNSNVIADGNIVSNEGSIKAKYTVSGNFLYAGDGGIGTSGTKSRIVDTEDYGQKKLYCYEMPSPIFGDIGSGRTDENGICVVFLDDIFTETVNTWKCMYHVFLTPYSHAALYVPERAAEYFLVKGEPNTEFAWEVKAKQREYEYTRLETHEEPEEEEDLLVEASTYIETLVQDNGLEQAVNEIEEVIRI